MSPTINKPDDSLQHHADHGAKRPGDMITPLAVFVVTLLMVPWLGMVSAYFSSEVWCLLDEGSIAYAGFRSALGEFPHIAFPYYYSGGVELILGAFFTIFGTSFVVARGVLGFTMACTAVVTYLLFARTGTDRVTGILSSLIPVSTSYVMNFHIFPGWFSQAFVLLAVLLGSYGFERKKTSFFIAAGVVLGVASAMKQTAGVYGFLGLVLGTPIIISPDVERSSLRDYELKSTWQSPAFSLVLVSPILVVGILTYVIRLHLNIVNATMFLVVPACLAVLGVVYAWQAGMVSADARRSLIRSYMTSVASAAFGFCIGFLPIVVFYVLNGGFDRFYNEAFVEIQEIVTRRYRDFSFSDADSLGSAFTMTRRVGLFGAPLFAVALGLVLGLSRMRREPGGSSAIVLILNSTVLSTMYLGLYPNPNRVQILFLAPMIMLPFVYGLFLFLKTRVKNAPARVALIFAFLVAPVAVYFGGRYISETPHEAASTEIALLDSDRGNIYLPRWVVDYISPVTNYLRTRPAEETFLGYDVYNKAMAFLAGRRAEADYFQRHQFREVGDSDIREIRRLAEDQKIDTIILGKSFLPGTEAEKELFSYLAQQYRLVLNTENHLGYQRAQNLKGR